MDFSIESILLWNFRDHGEYEHSTVRPESLSQPVTNFHNQTSQEFKTLNSNDEHIANYRKLPDYSTRDFGDNGSFLPYQFLKVVDSVNSEFSDVKLFSPEEVSVTADDPTMVEPLDAIGGSGMTTRQFLDDYPLRLPLWGIVILIIGYALVFIFGLIGNCSVLFVIIRLKRLKTVTNYFIFSLAVADILILIFCLLPNLISNIFVPWVLGWFLCKTVPYIQGVSVCAGIYFLVAISVERCVAIQWPFTYRITKEKAKMIIAAIWLFSFFIALPWAFFFKSGPFDDENPHLDFCIEVWPSDYEYLSTYYFLFGNFILCYILPLGIIFICNMSIWCRVWSRPIPSDCYHKAIELIHQRSKAAVIKFIIVVITLFALTYFPIYIIVFRIKLVGADKMSATETKIISILYPIAQFFLATQSCFNPLVYSYMNRKMRKAFISMICGNRKKNKIRYKSKSQTVNILLQRFSTYRVNTTMSKNDDSYDSI